MATSYSIDITAVENSVDTANNSSNVTVTLTGHSTTGYAQDNPAYWLKVDGVTVKQGTHNFNQGESFTLDTYTADIAHNADGTKTIVCVGYFAGTGEGTTVTKSLTLTNINISTGWIKTETDWEKGQSYIKTEEGWKKCDSYVKTETGWKKGN